MERTAASLGMRERWVMDKAAAGELPSYKLRRSRRFDPDEVRKWMRAQREKAGQAA
ncbi:MAG: helix-turn-helix domain-containing protein [Thermoanaerobaculia bacterium]